MNLLYHFDTEHRLSDFGSHDVPVTMCPISSNPCGEIWLEKQWRQFYQPDIDATLAAIKSHPNFVFAQVPVVSYRVKDGYFNKLVTNQTTMLNEPLCTYDRVYDLLDYTNMYGKEGEWHIVHTISVYTNHLEGRKFYVTMDVENIMPGGVSLTSLFRQFQIDELLKTL